ncbi:Uncharacterised protein [Mycobacteroides abscessus subsp. abscessus]|nr:Uncharacterised protein [Mycobacteroides abscessus subsp. abscessus]
MHRELADDRLAGSGRCTHQHALTVFERVARQPLEVVELEREARREAVELRVVSRHRAQNTSGSEDIVEGRGVAHGGASLL